MADRGDTHYHVPHLNLWFLISSVLLLVISVWMMVDDWNRPWKKYQREFRETEVEMAQAQIDAIRTEDFEAQEAQLQAAVEAAEAALETRYEDLQQAEEVLAEASAERYVTEQAAKAAKAEYDWDKYNIEEERKKTDDLTVKADELAASLQNSLDKAAAFELADEAFAEAKASVDRLREDVTAAQSELSGLRRDLDRFQGRIDTLAPSDMPTQVANVVRDFPGLDFIGPQNTVRKVVLENLTFELNFTKKTRIDMCMTCHLAIDADGWEDKEQPLSSHPRLDLYLTSKSPHPMNEIGCTICHRGAGEALDFIRSDHRPSDEAEMAEWEDKYHWHKQHHWDYPMLTTDYVEASCVQCHKTSMELIAEDAPKVTEGYRLFERYGCYSCHKVDWFPTKRKPGPSLTNVQAKLTDDFLDPWVADPRGFRPTTWMPQIFHLENYEPEAVVVEKSEWGAGEAILGQAWNDTAVAAVSAFIKDRAPKQEYPDLPVEGDAERGREAFTLSGCLGCHNMTPYEGDEPEARRLAFQSNEYNEHGPNLRGVATKITPEWLFAWIKDPQAYWSETRMPNLRLSDQDAADIVAYVMEDPDGIFTDVPEDWDPQPSPTDLAALQEQARWFFGKLGRTELTRRLEGGNPEHRWDDVDNLKVVVGEAMVMQYGCFSCHEISGMETMMPIGAELSNWGSKTVDKLDFGFAYRKEINGQPKLDHHYREGWLERKLHMPRSYDDGKVKNPKEKLRMPWFDFSDDEVKAIATFVVGLVDDEVQRAKMEPTPGQLAMDEGQRALRQKNCMACHVVDPGTIEFTDEDGEMHRLAVEPLLLEDQTIPLPMTSMEAFQEALARYEEDMFEVEELGFRLLETEPGFGYTGESVFIEPDQLTGMTPPRGGALVRNVVDYYYYGLEQFDAEAEDEDDAFYYVTADPDGEGRVQDVDGEFRAYYEEPYDKVRWTFAPPALYDEGGKLQADWFYSFLIDPVPLRQQIRVKMPTFHYTEGEAEAIADYFANKSAVEWPMRYTKNLRHSQELSVEDLAVGAGIEPSSVRDIESGNAIATAANFPRVLEYGQTLGFGFHGPVDPDYERVARRAPSHLQANPKGPAYGHALATDGVNCFQCHFAQGRDPEQVSTPIAWAPDLDIARERLREDWLHRWITDPSRIYPGTAMPANFQNETPQYQEQYPNSDNEQQIQAILDWLYNMDRMERLASD